MEEYRNFVVVIRTTEPTIGSLTYELNNETLPRFRNALNRLEERFINMAFFSNKVGEREFYINKEHIVTVEVY